MSPSLNWPLGDFVFRALIGRSTRLFTRCGDRLLNSPGQFQIAHGYLQLGNLAELPRSGRPDQQRAYQRLIQNTGATWRVETGRPIGTASETTCQAERRRTKRDNDKPEDTDQDPTHDGTRGICWTDVRLAV